MKNKIIQGDSLQVLKQIEDDSIHAIVSDIPYGISYDEWDVLHENNNSALGGSSKAQKKHGKVFKRRGKPLNGWSKADRKIPQEYQNWCESWATDWLRVLKPGASCFVFAGRRYASRAIIALENAGFTFKDMIAWEKSTAPHRAQRISLVYDRRGDKLNSKEWEGWRLGNLRPLYEPILWFQKPYKTGTTLTDNVKKYGVGAWNENIFSKYSTSTEDVKINSNIIQVKSLPTDRGLHDAQKPLNLMKFLIDLVTKENQLVLDPFAGSGTTCLAAQELNRFYIGIEKNPEYVDISKKRLNEKQLKM